MEVRMSEVQQKVGELLHLHRQRERIMKEKRELEKEYKKIKSEFAELLIALNKKSILIDQQYEISLVDTKKRKSMRPNERDSYIDNIINNDLEPEELAQSLKDALQGDIEYTKQIKIKVLDPNSSK